MKKVSLYLLLVFTLSLFTFCRNNQRNDSVDAAKQSNENKGMNDDDQSDFLVNAASSGLMEVELGRIAQDKARHPRVKAFARMMVDDHSRVNQELKDLASRKQITLPGSMSSDHQSEVDNLRRLKGNEFDQRYMEMMEDDHENDIRSFEDASENHRDSEIQTFAARTLPKLRAHLDSARMIRSAIRNP